MPKTAAAETFLEEIRIPFAGGYAILLIREIQLAAFQFAPVFLTARRLGNPDHHLVTEGRLSQLPNGRRDAVVERRNALAALEMPIDKPGPVLLSGQRRGAPYMVRDPFAAVELQKEEAVKEPVAVPEAVLVDDIGTQLFGVVVHAVRTTLIDQHQVANIGHRQIFPRGGLCRDFVSGDQQRQYPIQGDEHSPLHIVSI